jgi:hypothetical protein
MLDMTPDITLFVGLITGVLLTYCLMRRREELAQGAASTYKSAWDQLSKDHQASLEILKSSADTASASANGVIGVAGTMTNNMASLLIEHGAVVNRDYGGQALQLVRELLNRQYIQQAAPIMEGLRAKADTEALQALQASLADPDFVTEHDKPVVLRDTLNPTAI